ncbi:MAG TPA: class I SAM-dependent methyltransferase [Candidatus Baltobacteraceae bacterium]|jgi:demethylmenaquinone methyltransferase/2-methoxy-6-polyprenyl-1,4-benzoquinol methylase|nr:class I SAM-dependent methyltransferase [Candidatus Baltobacteraceae bacterium]
MTATESSTTLRQQLEYYRARVGEYDQWWWRQGRYDRGPALNAQWFAEGAMVSSALSAFRPAGRVLELACGTGIWSEKLLAFASHLTALDGSPEMLGINAARLGSPLVDYVEADIFAWQPNEQFDTVFFGFWLSHVPPERFAAFWRLVHSCLAPGGRVFFVDSRRERTSTAVDHQLPEPAATVARRRLNDGRTFEVCKIFYDPADLTGRLRDLGWHFDIRQTDHYFLYGAGRRQCGA